MAGSGQLLSTGNPGYGDMSSWVGRALLPTACIYTDTAGEQAPIPGISGPNDNCEHDYDYDYAHEHEHDNEDRMSHMHMYFS
jgi:hypothetical protein